MNKNKLQIWCHSLATDRWGEFVVGALVGFAVLVLGAQGMVPATQETPKVLLFAEAMVFFLFTLEAVAKLYGVGWSYFDNWWNRLDAGIVFLCAVDVLLVFVVGLDYPEVTLIRIVRLLRVAEFIPGLRRHAVAISRSFPGLFRVLVETILVVFMSSLIGRALFGDILPERWGTLPLAADNVFLSIFRGDSSYGPYQELLMKVSPQMQWLVRIYFGLLVFAGGVFLARIFAIVNDEMDVEDELEAQEKENGSTA